MSLYYTTLMAGLTPIDPYLAFQVAYYPFDTNSNDLINAQNGDDTNISYANAGVVGNSASFNGGSSLITIPNNPLTPFFSFGTSPFSINLRNFINIAGNAGTLVNKRNSTVAEYLLSYSVSLNTVTILLITSTGNSVGKTFNITLTKDIWQMVTITCAGGTGTTARDSIRLYVNAVEIVSFTNQQTGTYIGMTTTVAPVVFGRQGNTGAGYHNGRLDLPRFWNGRELTAVEILDMFNTNY